MQHFHQDETGNKSEPLYVFNDMPVKVIGCHAGLTVGPDGATHQALEDIAIMRALPNMQVIVPADMHQANAATCAIAETGKPAYLRLGRSGVPTFSTSETPFEIGKAQTIYETESADVTIVACGSLVYEALQAAKDLEQQGIHADVINLHTIKPIDRSAIIAAAKKRAQLSQQKSIRSWVEWAVLLPKLLWKNSSTDGICRRARFIWTIWNTGRIIEIL
jgi:transketolase C-terminal domain/subunit